ncbi:MAG: monooxygenase [Actinomycetes bacterium]
MPSVHMFIWRVSRGNVLRAGSHMGLDPRAFRADDRVRFAKALGTGSGRTFTIRDADTRQWATLIALRDDCDNSVIDELTPIKQWRELCEESLHLRLRPLVSRGSWAGHEPFADGSSSKPSDAGGSPMNGPIAAITRARVKARYWRRFNSEVPPVSTDLHRNPDLLAAIGIGEYPVGLQGTFSIWRNSAAINAFAYRADAHKHAIDLTSRLDWYAEEMFTRFAVESAEGTLKGVNPLE